MGKSKSKRGKPTMADRADKFHCYQKSVQTPEHEVEFFEQAYRDVFRRKPYSLREDFCGTFAVCCEWVASHNKRTAHRRRPVRRNLAVGPRSQSCQADRGAAEHACDLIEQDVRKRNRPPSTCWPRKTFRFGFSRRAKKSSSTSRSLASNLKAEGIMVMDMMGGGECYEEELVDKRTIKKGKKGFKYHWEQASFNPITADASFYISFKFADGSKLKRAFEYHWRFWTIPEVREMLAEAGFRESHVYWEIEDEDDPDLDGTWERRDEPPAIPAGSATSWR